MVVAVIHDQMGVFEYGCVVEVFGLDRPEAGPGWYRFATCAMESGPLQALGGVQLDGAGSVSLMAQADVVIVPGWRSPTESPPQAFLDEIRAAHARGALICSICSGAFALAWAGLLDGISATTHWRLVGQLQAQFPAIHVEPEKLFVDNGQILTSAGSAAGLDMMLHLVAREQGLAVANEVARRLNMAPPRHADQAQQVARPLPPDEQKRLTKLMDALRVDLSSPHTLQSMARLAAMSPRTLHRQFDAATGMSPMEWLVRERVKLASQWLEGARTPITAVGERAGFGSEESFRRHFRRVTGQSPAGYRRSRFELLAAGPCEA